MNVNLTLIVQMIHFLVAYFILKKILLQPGFMILEQEERERLQLQTATALEKVALENLLSSKQVQWNTFHQAISQRIPDSSAAVEVQEVPEIMPVKSLNIQQQQPLVDEVVATIVQKVMHD